MNSQAEFLRLLDRILQATPGGIGTSNASDGCAPLGGTTLEEGADLAEAGRGPGHGGIYLAEEGLRVGGELYVDVFDAISHCRIP